MLLHYLGFVPRALWKMFFILNFVLGLILLYPIFCVLLTRRKKYTTAFRLMRFWAKWILIVPGILTKLKREIEVEDLPESCVYVANHSSYLDIVVSYIVIPKYMIYMGKMEIQKAPLFRIFFRDMNIYVAQPTSPGATGATGATGSYVGVETNDASGTGSIQLRATTVGTVRPVAGNSYTASDILQTTPATITDPTYLASPGIQVGPSVDLVTKSAGGKGFSTYTYPNTLYYGASGTMTNSRQSGYMWNGTIPFTNTYPDQTVPVARYRVQQPTILLGMSATCNIIPAGDSVVITVCKNASPATGNLISNATPFTVTLDNTTLNANFYNASVTFNTGDFINLYISCFGSWLNRMHINSFCSDSSILLM